jgi:hypothetical protein
MMRSTLGPLSIAAVTLFACHDDGATRAAKNSCPNTLPKTGAPCPEVGMICNYFTGCEQYYPAICEADETWQVNDDCNTAKESTSASTVSTSTTVATGAGAQGAGAGRAGTGGAGEGGARAAGAGAGEPDAGGAGAGAAGAGGTGAGGA